MQASPPREEKAAPGTAGIDGAGVVSSDAFTSTVTKEETLEAPVMRVIINTCLYPQTPDIDTVAISSVPQTDTALDIPETIQATTFLLMLQLRLRYFRT